METPKKMTAQDRKIRTLKKQVLFMKEIFLYDISWDKTQIIRKGLVDGTIEQKEYILTDSFYNKRIEEYPLTEASNWRGWTGSTCNGYLKIIGGKASLSLVVYENRHYLSENIKFRATFILPLEYLIDFSSQIQYAFNLHLQDAYEKHLEEEAKKWKKAYSQKILLSTKVK